MLNATYSLFHRLGGGRLMLLALFSAALVGVIAMTPAAPIANAKCGYTCGRSVCNGGTGGSIINWTCADCHFGNYACCNNPTEGVSNSIGTCDTDVCGYDCAYFYQGGFYDDEFYCSTC